MHIVLYDNNGSSIFVQLSCVTTYLLVTIVIELIFTIWKYLKILTILETCLYFIFCQYIFLDIWKCREIYWHKELDITYYIAHFFRRVSQFLHNFCYTLFSRYEGSCIPSIMSCSCTGVVTGHKKIKPKTYVKNTVIVLLSLRGGAHSPIDYSEINSASIPVF